jgi:UDP-N-acetylglucosamine 2-epimerase
VRVLTVVGARPQFIKAAPLSCVLRRAHSEVLVHTGQHYDNLMSRVFFEELGIPEPDVHLGVGSGPHGAQTGAMLAALEAVMERDPPDLVLVYGDTNSTLAGALAAAKLGLRVAHVEAGLRSYNRAMPEETNRVLTDHVATWLFAPSEAAAANLAREGLRNGVHVVGDIMLDALLQHATRARAQSSLPDSLGFTAGEYAVCTVHRAENTDDTARLAALLDAIGRLDVRVALPLHPRTMKRIRETGLSVPHSVAVLEPLGYLDMLRLVECSAGVLTDSGGLQKEAYFLNIPCVTLRGETEWIETVATGWNVLTGTDPQRIRAAVSGWASPRPPHPQLYGDGGTAARIVNLLEAGVG